MENVKYDRISAGRILQKARQAVGKTQEQAANTVGCSLRHLIQIEGGTTGLSIDLLLALCSLYQITPNTVLGVADQQYTNDEALAISSYRTLPEDTKRTARVLLAALAKDSENV